MLDRRKRGIEIRRLEREQRPNRYVANALIPVTLALLLIELLVEVGIYNAVDKVCVRICTFGSIALTIIAFILSRPQGISQHPITKHLIMTDVMFMVGMLSTILNIHVVLILVLPMLLATQYYDKHFMTLACIGACICCIVSPLLAYFLNTWSFAYLSGYIEATCHVKILAAEAVDPDCVTDVFRILLYMVLPQCAILVSFGTLLRMVAGDGEKVFVQRDEIYLLNTVDPVTGLYKKDYFFRAVEEYIRAHPREKLCMLVTDISNFKMFNDQLGYDAGDNLLRAISTELVRYGNANSICARLADDHMAMLIGAAYMTDRSLIREVLCANYDGVPADYHLHLRVGVYEIDECDIPVSLMCDRAMMACHSIRGSNSMHIARYDVSMRNAAMEEARMTRDLEIALRDDQFHILLQPQVHRDGTLAGAEALVRWNHPTKGAISPAAFIPLCEKNGMITELDKLVWRKACSQLRLWKDSGHGDLHISVNASAVDLYRVNVYEELTSLVREFGISAENLNIEITETAIMRDIDRQKELIRRLQHAGFRVEMDDFGSGYSSLGVLKDLIVDTVKLDLSFLSRTNDVKRGSLIISAIVELVKTIGMTVVVEGVETEAQMSFLSGLDCDLYQGYLFSRPIEIDEFESRYFKRRADGR